MTTAVPNPQQGANAPLVGLVMGDVVTRSEDGTYSVQKQTVLVDEDGSKYGVSYKVSEDGMWVAVYKVTEARVRW